MNKIIIVLAALLIASPIMANPLGKKEAMEKLFEEFNVDSGDIMDMSILQNAFNHEIRLRSITVLKQQEELPSFGEGYIDVYEFSDYQCGFCRRMYPILRKYSDLGRIKVHVIELPLLGPASETAAQYAIAAKAQGKYDLFHTTLMETPARPTIEVIKEVMNKTGIDFQLAKRFVESGKAGDVFDLNYSIATLLGVSGTPSFVIEGEIFFGALAEEDFVLMLDNL